MYAQVEKSKENKSRAVANSVGQRENRGQQGFGLVDNRPESKSIEILQCKTKKYSSLVPQRNSTENLLKSTIQRFAVTGAEPDISIIEEDRRGGHTEERHVKKSDRYLKERAPDTPENMASSYTSLTVANNETKKCIHENWDVIKEDWEGAGLAGKRGNVWYTADTSGKSFFYKIFDHKGKEKIASTIRLGLARYRLNGNAVIDEVFVNTSHPTV